MKKQYFLLFLILGVFNLSNCFARFIAFDNEWEAYMNDPQVVVIASPGRSGSTLLKRAVVKYSKDSVVLKTHLMVPKNIKGKILYIYSNPDLATESALHKLFSDPAWGEHHFSNLFTADTNWVHELGGSYLNQTLENNLLCYDALGLEAHLRTWLLDSVTPVSLQKAQILAIKYEHLWDDDTVHQIMKFLDLKLFYLPPQKARGYSKDELDPLELNIKNYYNIGTFKKPRYSAYNQAREIWKDAPPYQYLRFNQ